MLILVFAGGCSNLTSESSDDESPVDSGETAQSNEAPGEALDADDQPEVTNDESIARDILPDSPGLPITITRVSDGDSVRATSPEGDLEIRLLGINAPEQDECFGSNATAELERLTAGREVTIHPWPAERDDFGRELGFLVADGVFVNLSLIESGHVVARAQSDHGFGAEFEEVERDAQDFDIGLWAPDACGAPADGELIIVEVFENAPGDDRENPNGEFIVIENVGDAEVDLEGWAVRDESTRHRHTFSSLVVAPGQQLRLRTGCGELDLSSDPIEAFWCDPEPPVWNNSGDTAFLLGPNGGIADSVVVEG